MLREGTCVVVRSNVPTLRPMKDGHGCASGQVHNPAVRMFSTPRVILLIGARSENLIEAHVCETKKAQLRSNAVVRSAACARCPTIASHELVQLHIAVGTHHQIDTKRRCLRFQLAAINGDPLFPSQVLLPRSGRVQMTALRPMQSPASKAPSIHDVPGTVRLQPLCVGVRRRFRGVFSELSHQAFEDEVREPVAAS